jgi:DNA polymerase-3 subunit epsilon
MFQNPSDLAAMAEALSQSTDYRVLRRLVPRPTSMAAPGQETRTGILLDTETTGLDHAKDEIIELGMVKFEYTPDGRIIGLRDTFSAFNEPSAPISAEVTALTGITDEMVAGHRFDDMAITAFVDGAVIVISHNSSFDRKFAERYWPVFEHKAWGCTMSEIDWRKHGLAGSQLGYLLNGAGYFHQAHRAVDDCHALLEVLAFELPTTGSPALALLLENAPQADAADMGGAIAFRAEGFVEEARLSLERRHGRPSEKLVHRRLRDRAGRRARVPQGGDLPARRRAAPADADRLHALLEPGLSGRPRSRPPPDWRTRAELSGRDASRAACGNCRLS